MPQLHRLHISLVLRRISQQKWNNTDTLNRHETQHKTLTTIEWQGQRIQWTRREDVTRGREKEESVAPTAMHTGPSVCYSIHPSLCKMAMVSSIVF